MALHRLTAITIGVPDVASAAAFYEEFGLIRTSEDAFATVDGGEQLRIVPADHRRLIEVGIGVDDHDDVERIASNLSRVEADFTKTAHRVEVVDPGSRVTVNVTIAPRIEQRAVDALPTNGPGRKDRLNVRTPAIDREPRVRPRKLGHVVIGSTDQERSEQLLIEGIGLKVSDRVPSIAAFMRCSTDHHNVLVQRSPVPFLHHTSWELDDVDEVGRGASAMLAADPERHVWGLGRHHIGSNYFWYLKDPAGNFCEYYADLDCIIDDELWTPGVWEGMKGLYSWGPPPPRSFVAPDDLAELMAAAHSAR